MKNPGTTLTLKTEFTTLEAHFSNIDVELDQYFTAFRGMLVGVGWSESTVNEYIVELAEDLNA